MKQFPKPGNFSSWSGVAPGNNESAGVKAQRSTDDERKIRTSRLPSWSPAGPPPEPKTPNSKIDTTGFEAPYRTQACCRRYRSPACADGVSGNSRRGHPIDQVNLNSKRAICRDYVVITLVGCAPSITGSTSINEGRRGCFSEQR